MDLSYIQVHADSLALGYSDARLLAFLREHFSGQRASPNLKFWLRELAAGTLAGQHQWNNLACILSMASGLHGFNATQPIAYCVQRASQSPPPPDYLPMESTLTDRWRSQLSE